MDPEQNFVSVYFTFEASNVPKFNITVYHLIIILKEGYMRIILSFQPQEHSTCEKNLWVFFKTPYERKILLSEIVFRTVKNISIKDPSVKSPQTSQIRVTKGKKNQPTKPDWAEIQKNSILSQESESQ